VKENKLAYFTVTATLVFGERKTFLVESDYIIGAAIKFQEHLDEIYRRIKHEIDEEVEGEPSINYISECEAVVFSPEWLDGYIKEVRAQVKEEEEQD
jgi:hypothetical protein